MVAFMSMPFYHSYLDIIEPLSDAERGRLFTACLIYSKTGAASGLTGNERFVFPIIQAQIDHDREAYIKKCRKNSENRKRRLAANGGENQRTPTNDNEKPTNDNEKHATLSKGFENQRTSTNIDENLRTLTNGGEDTLEADTATIEETAASLAVQKKPRLEKEKENEKEKEEKESTKEKEVKEKAKEKEIQNSKEILPPFIPPQGGAQPSAAPLPQCSDKAVKVKTPRKPAVSYSEAFLRFWEAYPRREDKQRAFEMWGRLNAADHGRAVTAAQNYAAEMLRLGKAQEYIRHPKTFLGKNSWEEWVTGPPGNEIFNALEAQKKAIIEKYTDKEGQRDDRAILREFRALEHG